MPDSEIELIKRAQADDTDAFCLLAECYARRIYLLAFHYCRNPQDAEDLSQEVWLKTYQALPSFRFECAFYTWLRRITINTFLNHQRSASARWKDQSTTLDLSADEQIQKPPRISDETIYNNVLLESVMEALTELTPSQRLMFLLRHREGMSYEEIAKEMGCSTGTAKKAVSRALGKLRAKLDASSDAHDSLTRFAAEY